MSLNSVVGVGITAGIAFGSLVSDAVDDILDLF